MSYGVDAIHDLIVEAGWSYPVSVQRLEREYALTNVEIDEKGHSTMIVELLDRVEANEFESESDLRQKLEPALEAEQSQRPSLLDRLKTMIFHRGGPKRGK